MVLLSSVVRRLGAFELHELIGSGGMSRVYGGVHSGTGIPVAIKILTSDEARRGAVASAIESEVRAVASLHHPGIVTVLDHGVVPEDRSPYLVMELATGGTLQNLRSARSWAELRNILTALLDALAHAHARDVIHRDLSPGNVLIATPQDLLPGLKIADFGIAFAFGSPDASAEQSLLLGTPEYMAPEQLNGRWRDFGPWTDLYALGVIAYRLACRRSPWPKGSPRKVLQARITDQRAPFEPVIDLPPGFVTWLERLLRWEVNERFQCAADAAFALAAIDDTTSGPLRSAEPPTVEMPAPRAESFSGGHTTRVVTLTGIGLAEDLLQEEVDTVKGPAPTIGAAPPIARTWKRPTRDAPSIRLVGAGLGLYPVRAVPFVDRTEERDRLWEGLREVHRSGHARAFVLAGPAGCGTSRLSEWIAQRAQEVGAAAVLQATHGRFGTSAQGLAPMLRRHLRCFNATEEELKKRVERELRALGATNEYEWDGLVALITSSGQEDDPRATVRFSQPSERYAVLRKYVERLSVRRPVIVRIEHAQWGGDALGFVQHVLASPVPTRVLFLITLSKEALERRPLEAELLRSILSRDRASALSVRPLAPDHHRELVRRLLPLEPTLSAAVAGKTEGNPLFAVHLVGEYVQRGLLAPTPEGFVLKDEERVEIPDDVQELWSVRLEDLLQGQAPEVSVVLELAAALGVEVDRAEWVDACAYAEPSLSLSDILEIERKLLAVSLARTTESGFVFEHEQIREWLERSAIRAGRWAGHHQHVVAMLTQRYPEPTADAEERLGRHSQAAGDVDAAVDFAYRAAHAHWKASALARALAQLEAREALLEKSEVSLRDARWAKGWLLRAHVLLQLGSLAEADELARRAADAKGEVVSIAEALYVRGQVHALRSAFPDAVDFYDHAASLFGGAGDVVGEGCCLRELGYVAQQSGEVELAMQQLETAYRLLSTTDDELELAYTFARSGLVARQQGRFRDSQRHFGRATELFSRLGSRYGVAMSLNGIGDAVRFQGQREKAERFFREALSRYESIGSEAGATTPRLNLALLALEEHKYERAYRWVEKALVAAEASEQRGYLGCAHLLVLPYLAETGAWEEWSKRCAEAKLLLERTGFVDVDVAWPAELAGDLAARKERRREAAEVYRLAIRARRALGHAKHVTELEKRLRALGGSKAVERGGEKILRVDRDEPENL